MRLFSDYHHSDLMLSLHLLLEHRLGHELYIPRGMAWYENKKWLISKVYQTEVATAKQFLIPGSTPPDGTEPLDEFYEDGCPKNYMTYQEFMDTEVDVLIASYIFHILPYYELAKQKKAKLITQLGNDWSKQLNFRYAKNIMASTAPFEVPEGINTVFYHQEMPLDIFKPGMPDKRKNKISSFIHTFDNYPDKEWTYRLESLLRDYDFKFYGSGSRDGNITGPKGVAKEMQSSKFGIHLKVMGDGFGHSIFQFFATATPPVVKYEYYKNQLAGQLMVDEHTCLFVDGLTPAQAALKIKKFEGDKYLELSKNAYKKFKEVINFDRDTENIKIFLNNLI